MKTVISEQIKVTMLFLLRTIVNDYANLSFRSKKKAGNLFRPEEHCENYCLIIFFEITWFSEVT